MAAYFVFHRLKKPGDEVARALNQRAPTIADAMASSQTPCRCLKTWSPLAYGREDYLFCLWDAENPHDIESFIESFDLLDYFTLDTMRVDEVDWLALGGRAESR